MFDRLAQFVTVRWRLVIGVWVVGAVILALLAPPWQSVTLDGDFAYLPAWMPSVIGQRWLEEAFPNQHAKSQIVVAVARARGTWSVTDYAVAYDVARRMKNLLGAARLSAARRLVRQIRQLESETDGARRAQLRVQFQQAVHAADNALHDAIDIDEMLATFWEHWAEDKKRPKVHATRRLAAAYHNLALLDELLGRTAQAQKNHRIAHELSNGATRQTVQVLPVAASRLPLIDVWTWRESYFGDKLTSREGHARLIILQLSNEFMAVDNIHVMRTVETQLREVRSAWRQRVQDPPQIAITGSAAVGADLLRSAAASIRYTERITILLVVLILAFVYRTPLLVVLPLATIGVALTVSTSLIALLAELARTPDFHWLGVTVFTTTRIFIVVILFGAGTDYCLFLIARYKEELARGRTPADATRVSLSHVGDALAASALTTVLGLSMMYFADFGKYHHSGPVIGLCLLVTLFTCVTLTPALMTALGNKLFWPFGFTRQRAVHGHAAVKTAVQTRKKWSAEHFWSIVSRMIVTRPGLVLVIAIVGLAPLAYVGVTRGNHVTFDFLSSLPWTCPSKQGAALLRRYFPVGESGPLTVLLRRHEDSKDARSAAALRQQVRALADALHVDGVVTVRSAEDPLGLLKPGEKLGMLSARARRIRILRAHPRTKAIFIAQDQRLATTLTRFDVIMQYDPFSLDAVHCVNRIERRLQELIHDRNSYWFGAQYALTGTTAAIRDLRRITRSDNVRIQVLVVGAVLVVLVIVLQRLLVSVYMMASVLFSYYVTLGVTQLFAAWHAGAAYQGLDWKTPLFLFVILVAVGQDYNVYLATRVFEEQGRLGPFAGLRRAVIRTGGIITSCGIIMAGTFSSMTGPAWLAWIPGFGGTNESGALQSILQLGFALTLGILLDTFIVRPILLPAFLALQARWASRRKMR